MAALAPGRTVARSVMLAGGATCISRPSTAQPRGYLPPYRPASPDDARRLHHDVTDGRTSPRTFQGAPTTLGRASMPSDARPCTSAGLRRPPGSASSRSISSAAPSSRPSSRPSQEPCGFGSGAPRHMHPHPASVLLPFSKHLGEKPPGPATYANAQAFSWGPLGPGPYRSYGTGQGPSGGRRKSPVERPIIHPVVVRHSSPSSMGNAPRLLHANPSYPNNPRELVPGPADYDPAEWRREARQHVPKMAASPTRGGCSMQGASPTSPSKPSTPVRVGTPVRLELVGGPPFHH